MTIFMVRRARKVHECTWCEDEIPAGRRYVEAKLPPWDGDVCNEVWLRDKRHLRVECWPFGSYSAQEMRERGLEDETDD